MISSQSSQGNFKDRVLLFLKKYWYGVLIHITLATVSCILALFFHNLEVLPPNDFAQYYFAAQELFHNPVNVYNPSYLLETYGVNAFRYFPTVLIVFFAPLSVFPLWDAFILFTIINVLICIYSVYLILEIIQSAGMKVDQRFLKVCVTGFLVFPFFFDFYFFGQISSLLGFLLLLSLYFYLKKRELLGSIFLGASLMVKPVPFFQILFLLFATLLSKNYKLLFKRFVFIIIPLVPDALIFLLVPGMLRGFLYVNFGIFGSRSSAGPTGSFSNFFVSEFAIPSSIVMLVCTVGVILLGLLLLRKIAKWEDKLRFSFIFGMLGYFIMQVDAWSSQFPYLYPFIIIALIYLSTEKARKSFLVLYFLYPIATEFFTFGLLLALTSVTMMIVISSLLLYVVIPVVSFSILFITIILSREIYKKTVLKIDDSHAPF